MCKQSQSSPRVHVHEPACIPARLVLEDAEFDRIVALLEQPPAPTEALRELMREPAHPLARRRPRR